MACSTRLRRFVLAALALACALTTLAASPEARAQGAPVTSGWTYSDELPGQNTTADPAVALRFCTLDPSTQAPQLITSTYTWAGVWRPDISRNVRVGEEFVLSIESHHVDFTCGDGAVRPSLRLPAGVVLAAQNRTQYCVRSSTANPDVVTNDTSAACPPQPVVRNGFLDLAPVGAPASAGWGITQAQNVMAVRVLVRATTAGTKTLSARTCDVYSEESGASCGTSEPRFNVDAQMSFTVDPSTGTTPPTPPRGTPAEQVDDPTAPPAVEYDVPFLQSATPTSVDVRFFYRPAREGRGRAEIRRFGQNLPFSTGLSDVAQPDGDKQFDVTFDGLTPYTRYAVRGCFVETAGTTFCGPWTASAEPAPTVTTALPNHRLSAHANYTSEATTRCHSNGFCYNTRNVRVIGLVWKDHSSGNGSIQVRLNGGAVTGYAGDWIPAARNDSAEGIAGRDLIQVTVPSTLEYRTCFQPLLTIAGFSPMGNLPAQQCSAWKTKSLTV